jgi:uncharacterized membrane protein
MSLKRLLLTAFACLFVMVALSTPDRANGQQRYRVVKFPPAVGLARLSPQSINNKRSIAGTTGNPQDQGFIWRHGKLLALPSLGGSCSYGNAISEIEHVVGTACLPGDAVHHATMWIGKQAIDLDTFGATGSSAYRINRDDEVAGDYFPTETTANAYFLSNGSWLDLGNLGGSNTYVFGLNDSGVVTGQSDISDIPDPVFGIPPFHGFMWAGGVLTDFGPIFGSDFNYGNDIDAAGRIVGTSDLAGDFVAHAIVYDHGTVHDLPVLPGDQVSWGTAINNRRQVVGSSGLAAGPEFGPPIYVIQCPCHAVLWENGQVINLESVIPPGWSLEWASAINDRGEILARALSPFNGPVLLEPITNQSSSDTASQGAANRHGQTEKAVGPGPRLLRRDRQGVITAQP